jgi:hypothetical protein
MLRPRVRPGVGLCEHCARNSTVFITNRIDLWWLRVFLSHAWTTAKNTCIEVVITGLQKIKSPRLLRRASRLLRRALAPTQQEYHFNVNDFMGATAALMGST